MLVSVLNQRFNTNVQIQPTSKKLETLLASYGMTKKAVDELVDIVNSDTLLSAFNADILALVLKYTSDTGGDEKITEREIDNLIANNYKGTDNPLNVKATFLIYYNAYIQR